VTASPSATTLARRMPDATGTAFNPERRDVIAKHGHPFIGREQLVDYDPTSYSLPENRAAARAQNAKAIRRIALETLAEPRLDDPNIRYCRAVLKAITDELRAAGAIDVDTYDHIQEAFDIGVEHAALAVAAAWLRERGSLPIPSE